jgi:hypothetical protein
MSGLPCGLSRTIHGFLRLLNLRLSRKRDPDGASFSVGRWRLCCLSPRHDVHRRSILFLSCLYNKFLITD